MLIDGLLENQIIWIPLAAWTVAQLLKILSIRITERRLDLSLFVQSGGMPSAHSATVSSLATAIGLTAGLSSSVFAIATVVALVVMYDAAGLRQAVGRQARILNRIIQERRERNKEEMEKDLRELIGHSPFQVFVGASLGIFIAWLWLFIAGR